MATQHDPHEAFSNGEQNQQDQEDEVLALESIYSETDRLRVMSRPVNINKQDEACSAEGVKLFTLQMDINVELADKGVTIEVWLPYEEDRTQPSTAAVPGSCKPEYHRTVSGRGWSTSFKVDHLTPVTLEVVLPVSYPSDGPPQFKLTCLWLDHDQLCELCKHLDVMWMESPGMPILYSWADWVQYNTLSTLDIEDTILLRPLAENESKQCDPRAEQTCYNVDETIQRVLIYNHEREFADFRQNNQSCGICFDEKLGSDFFRLAECLHHFCVDCMASYCEFHIQEGTVRQLTCLEPKCDTVLPPTVIQSVLEDETFDRWERLLLQNALSTMGDIEWCPRCNEPVIRETEEQLMLAHCTSCVFSFCTQCKDAWHQGVKCVTEEVSSEGSADEEQKKPSDETRASKWRKRRENRMSTTWIKESAKRCPSCSVPIIKDMGCNKVVCSNCRTAMCWLCGIRISGYDHFGNSCILFTFDQTNYLPPVRPRRPQRPEGYLRLQRRLEEEPDEAANRLKKCPKCKQENLKENRDNHVHCWGCRSHFCYLCVTLLQPPVLAHYKTGKCVQHSD